MASAIKSPPDQLDSSRADPMIGTNFGPYRIDEKLGQGGMGTVYKAFDTTLERPVALKVIRIADQDSSVVEASMGRFMREARTASRLQHPAIVTIHQFGVEGATQYIVMEYVQGDTLRKIIHDRPLPLEQFYEVAIQVAEGLATAHENNIVHRDMKADNVMVTPKGQAKILDFGLAKLKEPIETTCVGVPTFQTQTGVTVGTASHMSPEQAMGKDVDVKSDVFSFGVMLYHMATGKVPFAGPNPTVSIMRVIQTEPDPVRQLNPGLPGELGYLIHRCLQKDPVARPTSADVVKGLKALRDGVKIPVAPAPERTAAPPSPAVPATVTPVAPPQAVIPIAASIEAAAAPALEPAPRAAAPMREEVPPPRPKAGYYTVKALCLVVSWGLMLYSIFVLLHVVELGLPSLARGLEKFGVWLQIKPAVALLGTIVHGIIGAKTLVFRGWDLALAIAAGVIFVLRSYAVWALQRLAIRLKLAGNSLRS